MRCWSRIPRTWLLTALGAALLVGAGSAGAQQVTQPRVDIAYVANAPDLMTGGGLYVLFPAMGGLGLYVDAKFDPSSPSRKSNYLPDVTAAQAAGQFGDSYQDTQDGWRSFNVALIRPVTPALMVYAGAGAARKTKYNEYQDTSFTRGTFGKYWVKDVSTNSVNLMGGLFFRMSRFVYTQFGLESSPGGATVGLSIALPPK